MGAPEQANNPVARSLSSQRATTPQTFGGLNRLDQASASGAVAALSGGATSPALTPQGSTSGSATARGFSTDDLTIQSAPELNAIVVRGTPAAIAAIEPLIADLDVRRPQVMIEAAIVEITGDNAEHLAIQLGLGAAAVNRGDGAATSFSALGLPLRDILAALGAPAAAATLGDGLSVNVGIGNDFSILVQALGHRPRPTCSRRRA